MIFLLVIYLLFNFSSVFVCSLVVILKQRRRNREMERQSFTDDENL